IEAISSTTIISRLIEEEATIGDIRTLMSLRKGDMAIVEVELPVDRCVVCGKRVADLDLPGDCLIIAIIRGDDAFAVHGDTEMQPGDTVLAFTNVEHERALKKALTGS
ncbi:MAG: TrkA C-terminal domain-containing protein, partial [Coriobacteriia bacterium]|nr:TrkA C-terminal domain-containing protein [Coriobacteriia bacterium]